MNKEKVSKKEIKKKVLAQIETAMKEFKNIDNGKKFVKKMKEASRLLTDFIVHHSKAVNAKSKPGASKPKSKKRIEKKTEKVKTV